METIKKVKLLQNLPNVDKGAVFEKSYFGDYFVTDNYGNTYTVDECVVLEKTDWFTPYLFTSKDEIDIFKGDYVCIVYNNELKEVFDYKSVLQQSNDVYFSTKEKAEQYLQSLKTEYVLFLKPVGNLRKQYDIVTYPNGFKQDFYLDIDAVAEGYIKIFKTYKEAEEYRDSLKPKFKVGDIVKSMLYQKLIKITEIEGDSIYWSNGNLDVRYIRLANESEILKYYEQQGWVKGTKVKSHNKVWTFSHLEIIFNGIIQVYVKELFNGWRIEDCELIKEPVYPKSLEDIKSHILETNYSTEFSLNIVTATCKQYDSLLAFSLLAVLHKAMIDEYNKANNCDWKPDWNDYKVKYFIRRYENQLQISTTYNMFFQLAFPDKELAKFALKEWNSLWKQYYELK